MDLWNRIIYFLKNWAYDPPSDADWDLLTAELSAKISNRKVILLNPANRQIELLVNLVEFDHIIANFNKEFVMDQLNRPKIPHLTHFDSKSLETLLKISYEQFMVWKSLLLYLEDNETLIKKSKNLN